MTNAPDRVELLLRTSRRSLIGVLGMIFAAGATLIAHALRPGSLLSDWPSRAPWLIPMAIIVFAAISAMRRGDASRQESAAVLATVLDDEFRQANLARAQRLALVAVLAAQIPLTALTLAGLTAAAAIVVMAVVTVMVGMTTLIVSFLVFDRE